jgi:hypothetical protein
MKDNELRIGNSIQWSKVASMGIGEDVVSVRNLCYNNLMEPICLSDEWLNRLGFFSPDLDSWFLEVLCFIIEVEIVPDGWKCYLNSDYIYIKHVHQIQNLYHALTGEELTLNKKLQ